MLQCVAILLEEDGDQNVDTSFGEIRPLFKLTLCNENFTTITKELALVMMYEELRERRLLRLIDFIELWWCEGYYVVVDVGNIAIHVIPKFTTLDRLFVNALKL